MGQKHSSTSNWTVDDWAFGTGENAVQFEDVINEARKVPIKYFGGQAIENDASMHQMQRDLLSFDDKLKRIFFRRKKNKQSKKQNFSNEYYYQDRQNYAQTQRYYHQNQHTIPEEGESQISSSYTDNNQQTTNKDSLWRCRNCAAENKSTDIDCYQCKQTETRF